MAKQTIIYKEPKSYFNADMLKAAKEWEKQQKEAEKAAKAKPAPKKK